MTTLERCYFLCYSIFVLNSYIIVELLSPISFPLSLTLTLTRSYVEYYQSHNMMLVKRLPLSAWVHFLATLPWFDHDHPNGALCQLSLLNGNRKLVRQPTSQRPHHEDPQPKLVTWLTSRYGPRSLKKLWICPTCYFSNMCNIQPKPTTWFKLLMLRGIQKTVDGP